MDGVIRDVRQAGRSLMRRPGTAAAAAVSLGVGLSAAALAFSVVSALLLRPLPFARPEQTALVFTSESSGEPDGTCSYADYRDFRDGAAAFAALAGAAVQPVSLGLPGGEAQLVAAEAVTGNYFATLGVPPVAGRLISDEDDRAGAAPTIVLGEGLWRRRFGADPGVVGRAVDVNGASFSVLGVAPDRYRGLLRGLDVQAFVPMSVRGRLHPGTDLEQRGQRDLFVVGRLASGASVEVAQAQLDAVASRLVAGHPDAWKDASGRARRVSVLPESEARVLPRLRGAVTGVGALLGAVALLVLLIAGANVASLMLARVGERRKELAVRASLGATRARLARQILAEGVLLGGLGGACALLVTTWVAAAISEAPWPVPIPIRLDVAVDARVQAFLLVASVVVGAGVSLAAALRATSPRLDSALRDGAGTTGSVRGRLQRAFVGIQVAACFVLLVGGALVLRGLQAAAALDPGFSLRQGVLLSYDLELTGYGEADGRAAHERILEAVRSVPGVRSAALAVNLPLSLEWMRRGVWAEGSEVGPEEREQGVSFVSPGFFRTFGVDIVRGRGFADTDVAGAPGVVVVNQTFARRFWPGQDPLGRRLSVSGEDGALLEVVGVARDGQYFSLGEARRPFFFLPTTQEYRPSVTLVVQTATDAAALVGAVRAAVRAVEPGLVVPRVTTVAQHFSASLLPGRVAAAGLGAFGVLGLGLASLGLYGLLSQLVRQRTPEMGIRLALGATPGGVLRLVVGDGLRLVLAAMVAGGIAIAFVAPLLGSLLYGVSPTDPLAVLAAAVGLLAVAAAAAWLPARRASRIDPLAALRCD